MLPTGPALANDDSIDEIRVTATRRPASVSEVSSGLTLIEGESIREQKLVTDALSQQVGVFLQQTTPGQGAAIVRGLKGSAILHLVDGIRLNNAIFRSAPTQYLALVPPASVDRIELVRGAPTSLYGSDAVGGVVQVVSRVPRFDTSQTAVRGEVGLAMDSAELGKSLRGVIDIGNSTVAGTLSAEYLDTGDRKIGGGDRIGPSGYESRAVRAALSLTPSERQAWLFDVHYLDQPDTPRVDELVPGFGQTEPASSEFNFAPNERIFAHGRFSAFEGVWGLDWNVDLAWQRITDDRRTRDFGADQRRREFNSSDLYAATMSAVRETARWSWIAGAEFYYDDVQSSRFETDLQTGQEVELTSRFPDGSTIRQAAIYANGSFSLATRHTINAGLRLSDVRVDLAETPVSESARIDASDVSGDIGWIFDLTTDWQFVANLGHGFRAPNVFDLGTLGERPGNRFNIPNNDLESERVTQFDVGFRHNAERLQLELMLYHLEYDDRITSVGTGDTTPDGRDIVQSTNAASASVTGIEAGLTYRPNDRLTTTLILNYARGDQRVEGTEEEPADRIPPLNGELTARYDYSGTLSIDAWLRFAGEQDRLSARDIRDPRIDPDGTSGWGILGARASWSLPRDWLVSVALDNLLDKRYRMHGSGMDAYGRNVIASVRKSF